MKHAPQLQRHIEALRRQVRVLTWRAAAVDAGFAELTRRRAAQRASRSKVRWLGGSALALAASVFLVFGLFGGGERRSTGEVSPLPTFSERVDLGNDMQVRFEHGAEIDVVERTPTRVAVRLNRGAAAFEVRHEPERLFRVEAGDVSIEDRGTLFTVQHHGSVVDVAVAEGVVEVSFTTGDVRRRVTLSAGQRGSYATHATTTAAKTEAAKPSQAPGEPREAPGEPKQAQYEHAAPRGENGGNAAGANAKPDDQVDRKGPTALPPSATPVPSEPGDVDWRKLARAGEHQAAYTWLARRRFEGVANTPADLLLASDVARRALHPADAVPLLRRLLASHAADPSAPSAAFTLGWVLMSELGRNGEGAAAFERAVALAPNGNLAQDASARAVEAWQRAGETNKARQRFEAYCKHYPNGRHLERLQRLVGTP